jgi:recombination protein RecA
MSKTKEQSNIEKTFSFLEKINKDYAGFVSKKTNIEVIDSGSPNVNDMIGIGGFPRGRISHIYGPQGSGKSFLSLVAAKNALKANPNAYIVWFDTERSFCYDWAEKMGIWSKDPDKNRMLIIKKTDGVDIFEAIYGKIKKDKFGAKKIANGILDEIIAGNLECPLIVIDSLASIVSPKEKASPIGGVTVSALSGFLTVEIRRISDILEQSGTAMILINQVRQNMADEMFGEKYHHPGGENIRHQMSLNLYLEKRNAVDSLILDTDGDRNTIVGQKVKAVLKKSRFGPAPKNCETTFLFSEGAGYDEIGIVDVDLEILSLAVKHNLIIKGGAGWYTLPSGEKLQGDKKVQEYMKENPKFLEDLKRKLDNFNKYKKNQDGSITVDEKL